MRPLPALSAGWALPAYRDLQAADLLGDGDETLGVVQEQAGALVGGDAAGKAEGEDVGVEVVAGAFGDGGEEAKLAFVVGSGDAGGVDAVDRAEVMVVGAPVRDLAVEEVLELGGEPGGGVDAVGDGVDLVVGEHLLRDLAVLHGDAVDEAREAQGDVGHIHEAVVEAAELVDGGGAVVAEDLVHLVDAELVVAGGDWGVSGEDALLTDGLDVGFGRVLEGFAGEVIFEQADGEEGGVALVHVIDLGFTGECVEQCDAAEAEDGLLTEAVVGVAAVEVVGEAAVPGIVAFDVGVEQEDGDDVASDADDVEPPGADEDLATLHGQGDELIGAGKRCLGRPGDVGSRSAGRRRRASGGSSRGDGRARSRPWGRRCLLRSEGCRRRACRVHRSKSAAQGRERSPWRSRRRFAIGRSGVDGVRVEARVMQWLILFSSEPGRCLKSVICDAMLDLSIG